MEQILIIDELMLIRIKTHLKLSNYRKIFKSLVNKKTAIIENSQKSMIREPFSHSKSIEIISNTAGTKLKPCIVDDFKSINNLFNEISNSYDTRLETMQL